MAQSSLKKINKRNFLLTIGIALASISALLCIAFGIWITNKNGVFSRPHNTEAMMFIDIPGRIAIDHTLQVDGPAPVAVTAGEHTITLFDNAAPYSPLTISLSPGEFVYIPNPTPPRIYNNDKPLGTISASAFPPDTQIEIPDCTPVGTNRARTCKAEHTLATTLSPDTYTIKYSNPYLGEYSEDVPVTTATLVTNQHSFITTVDEWNTWRKQHGTVIEKYTNKRSRNYGIGNALLVPFEATANVINKLF